MCRKYGVIYITLVKYLVLCISKDIKTWFHATNMRCTHHYGVTALMSFNTYEPQFFCPNSIVLYFIFILFFIKIIKNVMQSVILQNRYMYDDLGYIYIYIYRKINKRLLIHFVWKAISAIQSSQKCNNNCSVPWWSVCSNKNTE